MFRLILAKPTQKFSLQRQKLADIFNFKIKDIFNFYNKSEFIVKAVDFYTMIPQLRNYRNNKNSL